MSRLVVTSGCNYADIDVLACVVAYTELQRLLGKNAVTLLEAPFNESVPRTIRSWEMPIVRKYVAEGGDQFAVVDVSEAKYFAKFIQEEQIAVLIDHHFGHEDYWQQKLGNNSIIEPVGSCATLIWEEWRKANCVLKQVQDRISKLSANLLYTAIISNSLNLQAQITKESDRQAAEELLQYTDLPKNWLEVYYQEVEQIILESGTNLIQLAINYKDYPSFRMTMGQLELWDGKTFIYKYREKLLTELKNVQSDYLFYSIPSIGENCNYLLTFRQKERDFLSKLFPVSWNGDIGVTEKLWLRKEIKQLAGKFIFCNPRRINK
ncbi:MAG: DHH family phosphoesterase [bacterium]